MNTRTKQIPASRTLLIACGLALTLAANAAEIGPWPTSQPYMWQTNPITPVCGTVSIDTLNSLLLSGFGSGSKAVWLPYDSISNNYSERMCLARLAFSTSTPVTNVHVRIYDPGKVNKHGWAVILVDSSGRIFDFGVRGFFAAAWVIPHQYDGSSWSNYDVATKVWTPRYVRSRYGDDYYTLDFTHNSDGTISWSLSEDSYLTNVFSGITGTSVVLYTNVNQVYLNASTSDTQSGNYRCTEFSVAPAVTSPPPVSITQVAPDFVLSWPSVFTTNFVLQANEDLSSTNWTAITNEPLDDLTTITVTVPSLPGNRFFRLMLP